MEAFYFCIHQVQKLNILNILKLNWANVWISLAQNIQHTELGRNKRASF